MSAGHLVLLEAARQAVRRASLAILEIYAAPFDVRRKLDASPVTEADAAAERLIIAALTQAAPDIPIIAEERAAAEGLPTTPPHRFWLVDPLDGTREFIAGNGEFTVNIGLVEGDRVVLGVVHVPVRNMTYAGHGPGSATRQQGDAPPVPIAARPAPSAGPIVVHSRSHADEARIAAFVARQPGAQIRISGSSVKFCLLAEGSADLYPRFGRTMEWDTAAGQAVLEAAGGSVSALDGTPLRYGKPGFSNSDFIARGSSG